MKRILHIVNGAAVSGSLRSPDISDIAYWVESLYQGPLSVTDDITFSTLRRAYWQEVAFWSPDWILNTENEHRPLSTTTQLISELSVYDSIILWFEFDLYDQTMLWYILRQFSQHIEKLPSLFLISPDTFPGVPDFRGLGELRSDQLHQLLGSEERVTSQHISAAIEAWEAYASGDKDQMVSFMKKPQHLPHAKRALSAWLDQEKVSPVMLGGIQRMLLTIIARLGSAPFVRIIGEIMLRYNPDFGLSDRAAAEYIVTLSENPRGLIEFVEGEQSITWKSLGEVFEWGVLTKRGIHIRITESGRMLAQKIT
jgi:hypothetical protein